MIVSASYRTDIPAFYGTWFQNRLAEGFCMVRNPYGGPDYRVDLTKEGTEAFVFWTRNIAPFSVALEVVRQRRTPFVVQQTITGYPRALDAATPDTHAAIAGLQGIAATDGIRAAVWRYDPILFTSLTPPDWHRANFSALAGKLAGSVDEVVVSFAQIYRKTRRNLDLAATTGSFEWWDPDEAQKRQLLDDLNTIAGRNRISLAVCGQADLTGQFAREARCIDTERLSDIAGRAITAAANSHREGCACAASRDIGAYDTCPHGCAYCYAVNNRQRAKARMAAHDPSAACL